MMALMYVPMVAVEQSIRSAIRVHARKEKHPKLDVLFGCATCILLLALNQSIAREAVEVE